MRIDYVATSIQAAITRARDTSEAAYDRLPDATLFWGMIDLRDSSNFRLHHGPKEGYVRGETFFSLVQAAAAPCSDVRILKEMGDAVLLAAASLRPILESALMIDQVAHQVAAVAGSDEYPFSLRSAIGFGTAKRLVRPQEDFLGHPIDRLSRVMGVRSETATILLDDEAYRASGEILGEYSSFLSVSESLLVPAQIAKGMQRAIYYRELRVDRANLLEFDEYFVPWLRPANGRETTA